MKYSTTILIVLILPFITYSQDITWWNPQQNPAEIFEGQGWNPSLMPPYGRLPLSAENQVRKPVWGLSKNSAGLALRFVTNSEQIVVKYSVKGSQAFPHMPATGVSGIDLYSREKGNWLWSAGKYAFGDTIQYTFSGLKPVSEKSKGREYLLYLPLYNTLNWLEIGTAEGSYFEVLPKRKEKPIVIYGTSIAQGGCSSRAGMAWANILGRKLDIPVVNLGFSGQGILEKEIIDLILEIDAQLYILDCLPNLTSRSGYKPEEVTQKVLAAVRQIRSIKQNIPVLLTEHAGFTDGDMYPEKKESYLAVNKVMKNAFDQLKAEGIKNIYLLKSEVLNQDTDSMVDGIHPTDLGMLRYANAYEKTIRKIIKKK